MIPSDGPAPRPKIGAPLEFDLTEPPWPNAPERRERTSPLLLVVLLVLIVFQVGYSLSGGTQAKTRASEKRVSSLIEALQAAKISVLFDSGSARRSRSADRSISRTLRAWRSLAMSKDPHASDVRRYALLNAWFHEQNPIPILETIEKLPKNRLMEGGEKPMPVEEELGVWRMVFGTEPVRPVNVPRLKSELIRLKLRWFEHLALAILYHKAGDTVTANAETRAADDSPTTMTLVGAIQLGQFLAGIGVLISVLRAWSRRRRALPMTVNPMFAPVSPRVPFSSTALLRSLVVYLAASLVIPFALSPALQPLKRRLSDIALYRVETALEIVISLAAIAIALALLRFSRASDNATVVRRLNVRFRPFRRVLWIGLAASAASMPILAIMSVISDRLFSRFVTPEHPLTFLAAAMETPWDRVLLLAQTAVIVPFVEETTFRGMLYPAFRKRWGVWIGVAMSSAVFAILHPTLPGQFLPLWSLGVVMAVAYEWSGSLAPGMIVHCVQNALVTLQLAALLSK